MSQTDKISLPPEARLPESVSQPADGGGVSIPTVTGSAEELAAKLKMEDYTNNDIMPIEALAWRARKAGCKEVEDACITVLCAIQGFWGIHPND